jgi:CSLREA domain-containing protein
MELPILARTSLMRCVRFAAAALLVAGLLAPPSVRPAYAQTITVTTTAEAPGASGDCTLGEAIQSADYASSP